ncbi:hypothetical protein [Salinispira pacifica]
MFASERFRRRVNRIRKEFRNASEEDVQRELLRAFDLVLSHIPEDMRADLFQYFLDRRPERTDRFPDLLAYSEYLGDVIDLFNLDYDEEHDPLLPDDWEYIRDTVSDFALDLDMNLVNYVMQLVVAKGYIE